MKKLIVLILGIGLLFSWFYVTEVEAGKKLQLAKDLCWQKTGEPDNILQLGISHMGGSHYFVSGKVYDDNGLKSIIFGNAESVGDNIYMNLIITGSDTEEMGTAISRVILNPSTLAVTVENIGHEYDYSSGSIVQEYGYGEATAIPCPGIEPL